MQIEIQGADAIKVAQDILEMEGVQGSYEVISEVEREGTLATIATIIGIISGTIIENFGSETPSFYDGFTVKY
jgi:CheY-specific phosphatase CheX